MSMTRKDYVLVSQNISARVEHERAKGNEYSDAMNCLYSLVSDLAIGFANENPHFDMTRFFKACGFHDAGSTRCKCVGICHC